MKRLILYTSSLLLCSATCVAQSFSFLTPSNGLSHRTVFSIVKDSTGYVWMLTSAGVDRFNGKTVRHYSLSDDDQYPLVTGMLYNQLSIDPLGRVWEMGRGNAVYHYNRCSDSFDKLIIPNWQATDTLRCYDEKGRLWASNPCSALIFNTLTHQTKRIVNPTGKSILSVAYANDQTIFLGTTDGVYEVRINQQKLLSCTCIAPNLKYVCRLHYHPESHQLIIAPVKNGIYSFHTLTHQFKELTPKALDGFGVRQITADPQHPHLLYLATRGCGLWKMDLRTNTFTKALYRVEDEDDQMNGNIVGAVYADNESRLWMAVWPVGVTIYSQHNPAMKRLRHHLGNNQSLVNNQVNQLMQDSDGDIWMATGNGISIYSPTTHSWRNLLHSQSMGDRLFLSFCELRPGTVLAAGAFDGVYQINKQTMQTTFTPFLFSNGGDDENKYIRSMVRIGQKVWYGGHFSADCSDLEKHTFQRIHLPYPCHFIYPIADSTLLVATTGGLFHIIPSNMSLQPTTFPLPHANILSICQSSDGSVYVGTARHGFYVRHAFDSAWHQFSTHNSSLLSNAITNITELKNGQMLITTECNILLFHHSTGTFHSLPQNVGLQPIMFNENCLLHTRNGLLMLGSNDGVIVTSEPLAFPSSSHYVLTLERIMVNGRNMCFNRKKPTLNIPYQSNLQIAVGCINFDKPDDVYYRWHLSPCSKTWYKKLSPPIISYHNLTSGTYTLTVEMCDKTTKHLLATHQVYITVKHPWWLSTSALLTGALLVIAIAILVRLTLQTMQKLRRAKKILNRIKSSTSERYQKLQQCSQCAIKCTEHEQLQKLLNNNEDFIRKLNRVINQHMRDDKFNVDSLCAEFNMSRTSFYQKMKDTVGCSPSDYVRRKRLERACYLLENSTYSVTDITYLCGFSDAKYFTEVFKRYFHITPSEYAKTKRKQEF